MTIGERFVAGAKLANKALFFVLNNKRLVLYQLVPLLMIFGAGISYAMPIIKTILASKDQLNDPNQLMLLLMSKPDLFSPSLITKILAIATAVIATIAVFTQTYHLGSTIKEQPVTRQSIVSALSSSWLGIIIWSLFVIGVTYSSVYVVPGNSLIISLVNGSIAVARPLLSLVFGFAVTYMVLKKKPIVSALGSSAKLFWQNLAPILGATLWTAVLSVLVFIITIVPIGLIGSFIPSIQIIQITSLALAALFFLFVLLFIGTMFNAVSIMLLLWAHKELPPKYDTLKKA